MATAQKLRREDNEGGRRMNYNPKEIDKLFDCSKYKKTNVRIIKRIFKVKEIKDEKERM